MSKTVDVAPQVLTLCGIKARLADLMTREETQMLMRWCDCQTESLWDYMPLQSILNVYRVSAEWQTWEDWRFEDFDAAGRAWNRVVGQKDQLETPTRASLRQGRRA